MIQLAKTKTLVSFTGENLQRLSARFNAEHHIILPQLVEPQLLDLISQRLKATTFRTRVYKGLGKDLCPDDIRIASSLNFLCNRRQVLDFIEALTGSGHLGCFVGKVYRMIPGQDHYDSWHDDVIDNRKIALSINLTGQPYSGGVLEIRESRSKRVLSRVGSTGFGDGIIFPIAADLEHRRTTVSGSVPKTAFAGWFKSKPDFFELLQKSRKSTRTPAEIFTREFL